MAPVINPASGPRAIPVIMITAVMGLKPGMGTTTREATARAHITATVTSSLAWGFRVSKARKKGIMVSRMMSVPVR